MITPTLRMETRVFNREVKRFIGRTDISTEQAIKKIALDLLSNILLAPPKGRHPIDTGRARAGWYMSAKGLGKQFDFSSGIQGENQVDLGKREGAFRDNTKYTANKWVELINGVDYILFLEYGASKQAPYGMVRISMRKMRGKMPKKLTEEFRKDWNRMRLF